MLVVKLSYILIVKPIFKICKGEIDKNAAGGGWNRTGGQDGRDLQD
jgi:hypothetical protein